MTTAEAVYERALALPESLRREALTISNICCRGGMLPASQPRTTKPRGQDSRRNSWPHTMVLTTRWMTAPEGAGCEFWRRSPGETTFS